MYWFRVENPWIFGLWLAVTGIWVLGGWLIARHAFKLESPERPLLGFGLGLSSYLFLCNLLGHWLAPEVTFIGAAVLVLAIGSAYAWNGERPVLDWNDLKIWRWLLVGLVLVVFFAQLARGLGIFDDRKNISIISTMAAGDIPPHHYMNSAYYFAYHYGFQLLGASLMRLGGLLPWSAFDLSKAIAGAYTLLLAALVGKRYVGHPRAGLVVAGVLALATGTRYLLLLAPAGLMARVDPVIGVRSVDAVVGMPLSKAILQGIWIDDGPPAPFIYAFMNGIGWPVVMAVHAGPSSMSLVILLMTWLLAPRLRRPAAALVMAMVFSIWALVWESSYVLFVIGGAIAGAYWLWRGRQNGEDMVKWVLVALAVSVPLALVQGGTITELARKLVSGVQESVPLAVPVAEASLGGFSLRWPPAIYSGHLGAMSLFSLPALLVAILEVGPVVLFTPWITWWAWKRFRDGDWVLGALSLSAWVGFLLPVFFSYEYDRDIVRFSKHGLLVWTIALTLMVWENSPRWLRTIRYPAMAGLGLMVLGGLVIAGTELTAASQGVLTEEGINGLDSRVAQDTWDRLPPGSEVFDAQTWRATTLTGRLTRVVEGNMSYDYGYSAKWEQLRADPSVEGMLSNGFRFVYIDEVWWKQIPEEARQSLSRDCVRVVSEVRYDELGRFRRLIDLGACGASS
jgi:hypothetical protein